MKTSQAKRLYLLCAIALLSASGYLLANLMIPPRWHQAASASDPAVQKAMQQLATYQNRKGTDRVYLQLDKALYKPGETIWFQAYLTNVKDMRPSRQSDIIHVELINPQGNTTNRLLLVADKGTAGGDITLPEDVPGGIYKIKAYTNDQLNNPDELLFEKEIQLQRVVMPRLKMKMDFEKKAYGPGDDVKATVEVSSLENKALADYDYTYTASVEGKAILQSSGKTDASGKATIGFKLPDDLASPDGLLNVMFSYNGQPEAISRSIPITLNKINLSFFPEGGDLVAGLKSRVAFRALNEFDKPADIDGVVKDEDGHTVAHFSSLHMGMGAFSFSPEAGERYTAYILRPAGISQGFELPFIHKDGYVMQVTQNADKQELHVSIQATRPAELALTALLRDRMYHSTHIKAHKGRNEVVVPLQDFPMGVAQLSLYDKNGTALAERLTFVNRHKQMHISLHTDKEKYAPREKVQLQIEAKDAHGKPIQGHLSLAVVDDKLLSFADDRTGTILARMLLEPELKDKVEEPNFYFDDNEPQAEQALDYLMMTSGWRRFEWIKRGYYAKTNTYPAERAIVKGRILGMDSVNKSRLLPHARITLQAGGKSYTTHTNAQGEYSFHITHPSFPMQITAADSGYNSNSSWTYNYGFVQDMYLYNIHYQQVRLINDYQYSATYQNSEKLEMRVARVMPSVVSVDEVAVKKRKGDRRARKALRANVPQMAEEAEATAPEPAPMNMPAAPAMAEEAPEKLAEADVEAVAPAIQDKNMAAEDGFQPFRGNDFKVVRRMEGFANNRFQAPQPAAQYYQARVFPAPVYHAGDKVEQRTDFRSTIYWQGGIQLDDNGKATVSFYNSDDETAFRATVEGIATNGLLGHAEATYHTEMPFSLNAKIPQSASVGDEIKLSLLLKNNTADKLEGNLTYHLPTAWEAVGSLPTHAQVAAHGASTLILHYRVLAKPGKEEFEVGFASNNASDAIRQEVVTEPKGFPATLSFGGTQDKEFSFSISKPLEGSLEASFKAYPSILEQNMSGLESILREPSGCFEQVSSSNYPNILVLQYLRENGQSRPDLAEKARKLLASGYGKLTAYETKEKGYEWFGGVPASESLTAYGLLEFNDMKNVYAGVDNTMVDRTAKWMLNRKDGKGGFQRDSRALDQFGAADPEVTNAYIVYALAEAGYKDGYAQELDAACTDAVNSSDPYRMGLVANALLRLNDARGNDMLNRLAKLQKEDGSWEGKLHSITRSTGQELNMEATALAMMALAQHPEDRQYRMDMAARYLATNRSGYGGFGNTQTTVMVLKALNRYTAAKKGQQENGTIEVYIDGQLAGTQPYTTGAGKEINIAGLEKYLGEGQHRMRVHLVNAKEGIPYAVAIHWNTNNPQNSAHNDCKLELQTSLSSASTTIGQTVRLTAQIRNLTQEGLASPTAIIGIPAGLSLQPWQLKELQEKHVFDYYEIRGNNLVCYYRQMTPGETKTINLDLKADIAGVYEAPASNAYLYYNSGPRSWSKPDAITIHEQ